MQKISGHPPTLVMALKSANSDSVLELRMAGRLSGMHRCWCWLSGWGHATEQARGLAGEENCFPVGVTAENRR